MSAHAETARATHHPALLRLSLEHRRRPSGSKQASPLGRHSDAQFELAVRARHQRLSQEGEAWEVFNVSGAVLNVNHESHTPVTTNLTLLVLEVRKGLFQAKSDE